MRNPHSNRRPSSTLPTPSNLYECNCYIRHAEAAVKAAFEAVKAACAAQDEAALAKANAAKKAALKRKGHFLTLRSKMAAC